MVAAMALVLAKASADKTRLSSKGRYRPHWIMRKKMPDGTGELSELPVRARLAERVGEEAADDEYCKAIATATKIFGKKMRGQSTADEHVMYIRLIDGWLTRMGFGSYVEAELADGRCVAVRARRRADGTIKVMRAEMLMGHLLEMAVGGESVPKGGHAADLMARAATEVATACGKRSKMRCARARTRTRAAGRRSEFLVLQIISNASGDRALSGSIRPHTSHTSTRIIPYVPGGSAQSSQRGVSWSLVLREARGNITLVRRLTVSILARALSGRRSDCA